MRLLPLPYIMEAMTDYWIAKDNVIERITEGFNLHPHLQTAYPLAQRLEQERNTYRRTVEQDIKTAIDSHAITLRSRNGAPSNEPPWFVSIPDLTEWLNTWMDDVKGFMQTFEAPAAEGSRKHPTRRGSPRKAPARLDVEAAAAARAFYSRTGRRPSAAQLADEIIRMNDYSAAPSTIVKRFSMQNALMGLKDKKDIKDKIT
ncbi:hypothetical protein HFU84_00750 [Acidithiobacillus sp. CV18-2]|nr:hypothetical protein [Acidithiobacillus sp. CV18-3]MBU2757355.1 hypothetical protein [Acidithiobacillus sp. BN09-2]MBU2776066.1 hypothetical protein [Acidithiobacillus sp. CV18-2]MBU2800257.1 hypothetical protein [Acidithiobacillus sp. VAN18-4]